jgi:hypothetical protein
LSLSFPIQVANAAAWMGIEYQRKAETNTLNFCFEILDYIKEALVETAVLRDGFLDGDVGDVETLEDSDATPLLFMHHVDGVEAVALAK